MWSLLNPIFLWAMAAAVIPLILHLLQKRRIVTIRFSTLRFLKLAQRRSSNRVRLENFLLWLLRTLLMLLLALAFTLPILRVSSFQQIMGGSRRDVAIVWDVSYSMDYASGKNKVWDAARETIAAILDGLKPGDRVCIFLADEDVTPLIEQPTANLGTVLSQIKAQEIKLTASRLPPALLAACNALKEARRGDQEVHVVTDGQKLPWLDFSKSPPGPPLPASAVSNPPAAGSNAAAGNRPAGASNAPAAAPGREAAAWNAAAIDPNLAFFVTVLGVAAPENTTPLAVDVRPKLIMDNGAANLLATLGRTGPAQATAAALFLDDKEINRQALNLENDGRADAEFLLPPLPAGLHAGWIETPVDGLPIDNQFFFLLRVVQKLPVLCVGTEADAFFLLRALNPWVAAARPPAEQPGKQLAVLNVRRIDANALGGAEPPPDTACVFLCNAAPISGQALASLERYVRQGGLLVLFPGDRGRPADYAGWTCLPAPPKAIQDASDENQRRILRLVKPGDPLFDGMRLPPGALPTIVFRREIVWDAPAAGAETIIAAGNDRPFLMRRAAGLGCVFAFSVSADRGWSTLPLSPFFLPIAHQIVQYSAAVKKEKMFFWTGRNLVLNDLLGSAPDNATLLDPANAALEILRMKAGVELTVTVEDVSRPGIYQLRVPGKPAEPLLAANLTRAESDLSRIPLAEIPELLGVKKISVAENIGSLQRQVKEHRTGRPLSEALLWLAFIIGLLEVGLANLISRQSGRLLDKLVVEDSGRVTSRTGEAP